MGTILKPYDRIRCVYVKRTGGAMSKIIHIHLKGKSEPAIFPGAKTAVVDGWLVITDEGGEEVGKFNIAEIQGWCIRAT
jgi:hypothetical protein